MSLPPHLRLVDRVPGMISLDEADLLYRLAAAVDDGCIIEVGSYRGRSTTALAAGSMDGSRVPVYAIEPHESFSGVLGGSFGPEDRAGFFRSMLETASYQVVRLVNLSSESVAPTWTRPVGLLWIDGDHRYPGVRRDVDCWEPHLAVGAVVAFDDATDDHIGPHQVIAELLLAGRFVEEPGVGKVRVLRRR